MPDRHVLNEVVIEEESSNWHISLADSPLQKCLIWNSKLLLLDVFVHVEYPFRQGIITNYN